MAKGRLTYKLYQQKNSQDPNSEPMWYARASKGKTYSFEDLVEHMSDHNTVYPAGVISGVLQDMLKCVRELVMDGKQVRLGDLGLFSINLRSKGALTSKEWKVASHLKGVSLNVRNTKKWSNTWLRENCEIVEQGKYTIDDEETAGTPSDEGSGTEAGE